MDLPFSGPSASAPRVIVVDDDPDILFIVRTFFESEGASVVTADDPEAGLELVRSLLDAREPPHIVIIDIRMPRMDGHELARRLRQTGYQGPVIAFTADPSVEGRDKGRAAGITSYLSKTQLNKTVVAALLHQYGNGVRG